MKIGTHDSATGESSYGLLSKLLIPTARTQSKTIKQQYEQGCRFFDLRVKYRSNQLVFAHGLWESKKTFSEVLNELKNIPENTYIIVTFEGSLNSSKYDKFIQDILSILSNLDKIKLTQICVKKPWKTIYEKEPVENHKGFIDLSKFPYFLFPIPWFWNKIKHGKFNENNYILVDFL